MGLTGKITIDEMKEILFTNPELTVFIETGTYKADTTLEMAKIFPHVYSIELYVDRYLESINRCAAISNIKIFHKDSIFMLPILSNWLNSQQVKCVWFLDAHQSGPDTKNNGISVPLFEELSGILNNIFNVEGHVFIFDDARLFDAFNDWKGINETTINNEFIRCGLKIKNNYIKNDRYIVLL